MSPRRVTARAPSNIAFIKYWGARDLERPDPLNASFSMTLERLSTTTTLRVHDEPGAITVHLVDESGAAHAAPARFAERATRHLELLRELAGSRARCDVFTRNAFPSDAGLASSASGFAALACAAAAAFDLGEEPARLSELARLSGSGSAARSVLGGWVEWPARDAGDGLPAFQAAPPEHWELCDVVALVQTGAKAVSSLDGHGRARTSPHFEVRRQLLPIRLEAVRGAVRRRDFTALAPVLEEEALELHMIAMTSRPPIFYWEPATLAVLQRVRDLRAEGLECASTMDAGANVHVICTPAAEPRVADALAGVEGVHEVLRDRTGRGPTLLEEHLA